MEKRWLMGSLVLIVGVGQYLVIIISLQEYIAPCYNIKPLISPCPMLSSPDQSLYPIIEQQPQPLPPSFFPNLILLQQSYTLSPSQLLIQQLITVYSDCIFYFQHHSQAVSIYFQHKMKKLLLNKRKVDQYEKLDRLVRSDVSQTPILQKLTEEHEESVGKYTTKVSSIIDQQKQILAERRVNRSKYLRSSSVQTMSMGSLFDTPERYKPDQMKTSKVKLFESLIDDDEDSNNKESAQTTNTS